MGSHNRLDKKFGPKMQCTEELAGKRTLLMVPVESLGEQPIVASEVVACDLCGRDCWFSNMSGTLDYDMRICVPCGTKNAEVTFETFREGILQQLADDPSKIEALSEVAGADMIDKLVDEKYMRVLYDRFMEKMRKLG